jgi:hypothetical protein
VIGGIGEETAGSGHVAGVVAAGVDDDVPLVSFQWGQVDGAVAPEVLVREEAGVRLPSREEGDFVPGGNSGLDEVTPHEHGPAENEQPDRQSAARCPHGRSVSASPHQTA